VATNLYGKSCTPNTGGILDFYTKGEINQLLAAKAGVSSTYTRVYLDGQLSSLGNSISSLAASAIDESELETSLSALRVEIENDVAATYATLANTYTQSEVDSLISSVNLDPDTLLRRVPTTTATNTVSPGTNDVISLTLRGSSVNPIVQRWLDDSGDVIGYVSNDGTTTFEGKLTIGRLVSTGSVSLDVRTNAVIYGDLQVLGTTTTVNATTVDTTDKVINLSTGATTPSQADGSGISVSGALASILYNNSSDSWDFNKALSTVDGTSASPAYSFTSEPTTGIYLSGSGSLSVTTSGDEKLRVDVNGNTTLYSGSLVFNQGTYSGTLNSALLSADRTYTLPDISGTLVTTGDTGSVTSTMIADGTIVDADISETAEIAVSKLADGSARQLLQTDAAGTGVEWTSNIDIPGTLDVTGVATFDTLISIGAAEPVASQQVGWNADKGTLDIGLLNGVLSPLGQDIITICRNGTASPIPVGTAVMFTGETDGNSGRLYVAPMVADGTYPGYVFFGVAAQNIAAGADGYVRSFGEVKGVDTDIDEGGVDGQWAEGDILWCDPATPGGFTKFEPQAPNLKLPIAAVISVKNNGIVMVRWDTGRRLSDLHDVESNGTTADNELLVYNATASRWEHGKLSNFNISDTAEISIRKLAALTSGYIILGNSNNVPTSTEVTGDITISNSGVTSIATGSIINEDINESAAISLSKLESLASGQLIVGNGSNVPTATEITGDITISNTGVTGISAGAIVDEDISPSASISLSKLEALTSGNIVVGDDSNVASSVPMSGDVTISDTGVTTVISGTTSTAGKVQLSTATNSTSTTLAATPSAVKSAYDLADSANSTASAAQSTANEALPKAGGTMTGEVLLDEIKEKVHTLATSGSIALDPANGSIQVSVLTGAPTFTDSLEAGQTVVLMIENGASYTVTWPTITWISSAGNAPPTLTAKDTLVFWKVSTTLYGAYVGSYV